MPGYSWKKTQDKVSSMIHSARPTVSPVAIIISCCFVLLDFKSGDRWTDNMCENNDPYRTWLWVGRVDQLKGLEIIVVVYLLVML